MNAAETIAALTKDGVPMLLNAVKAVPEDKLDWKPAEGSRTVRQLFTESVMMLSYVSQALAQRGVPAYDELAAEYAGKSIEELVELAPKNADEYVAALTAFPEADFNLTLEAPWGVWTYFQTMGYPYWNLMWHAGQINYIQTLYGDQNFY